jgi:hypothetical protein
MLAGAEDSRFPPGMTTRKAKAKGKSKGKSKGESELTPLEGVFYWRFYGYCTLFEGYAWR